MPLLCVDTRAHFSCLPQDFLEVGAWELAPWPLPAREPHLGHSLRVTSQASRSPEGSKF